MSTDRTLPPPPPAWTPRAQVLMREAEAIAIQWRHRHVGTEHLLLALIEHKEGVAGQFLEQAGVSEQLKQRIEALFGSEQYYGAGVMVLDENGKPIIDPETGEAKHRYVPPQPDSA